MVLKARRASAVYSLRSQNHHNRGSHTRETVNLEVLMNGPGERQCVHNGGPDLDLTGT